MKLSQLIKGIDIINLSADAIGDVSTLCYAADKCEQDSIFVAVRGLAHDGHDFIADAVNRGARYIIHEKDISIPSGVIAIKVNSSRRACFVMKAPVYEPRKSMNVPRITRASTTTPACPTFIAR